MTTYNRFIEIEGKGISRRADTIAVLQWVSNFNARNQGAAPESAEFITGCEHEEACEMIVSRPSRPGERNRYWLTDAGIAKLGELLAVEVAEDTEQKLSP